MPRPLCLVIVLALLAGLAGAARPGAAARWWWWPLGGGGAQQLSPEPPARFALISTAAPPACAASCALVLEVEGKGRVLASLTPLRPRVVAVVEGGGGAVRAAVRCPPGSGCSPLGPAAAGLSLGGGGSGADAAVPATPFVLDGLLQLAVYEEVRSEGSEVGGQGGRRPDEKSETKHDVRASSSSFSLAPPLSPPRRGCLDALSTPALTALAILAAASCLAVASAVTAARRGAWHGG